MIEDKQIIFEIQMHQWEKENKISKEFSHDFYAHLKFSEAQPEKQARESTSIIRDQKLHLPSQVRVAKSWNNLST